MRTMIGEVEQDSETISPVPRLAPREEVLAMCLAGMAGAERSGISDLGIFDNRKCRSFRSRH